MVQEKLQDVPLSELARRFALAVSPAAIRCKPHTLSDT